MWKFCVFSSPMFDGYVVSNTNSKSKDYQKTNKKMW